MNKCINEGCEHNDEYTGDCGILLNEYIDYCKHYIPKPEPEYYKILVPKGAEFTVNYKCRADLGMIEIKLDELRALVDDDTYARDLNIKCTLEKGDIENG